MYKVGVVLLMLFFLIACNKSNNKYNYDQIIEKYEDTDFSDLKGTFISIRQRTLFGDVIYIVSKSDGKTPVYFVTYNKLSNKIERINRKQLEQFGMPDYYTNKDILDIVRKFRKYDLYLLGVYEDGDVILNPYRANEPGVLLRAKAITEKDEIIKGYTFEHYKEAWYINFIFNTEK